MDPGEVLARIEELRACGLLMRCPSCGKEVVCGIRETRFDDPESAKIRLELLSTLIFTKSLTFTYMVTEPELRCPACDLGISFLVTANDVVTATQVIRALNDTIEREALVLLSVSQYTQDLLHGVRLAS